MAASNYLSIIAVIVILNLGIVTPVPQCLKFRWLPEEDARMRGIHIYGTISEFEQVALMTNETNADDCFYECCKRAVNTGDCNAASFYVDPNGFPQCFLLNCNPFSDCQWTLSASSDAVGAYMKVSMSDNPSELQTVALAVEEELRWNIFYPTTSGNRLNVTDATTITMESTTTTTPAPITQKPTTPELTTQVEVANIEVTTTPKPATTTEKVLTTEAAATNGKVEWPELPSSTADAGMGNQDVGDAADLVKGTDEPAEGSHKSFGAENQKKGVNVAAVVICSIGGIALFIAGVVIAFKRYQIDKDRSVYRPLMDDINTRAFKESDPLH